MEKKLLQKDVAIPDLYSFTNIIPVAQISEQNIFCFC